MLGIASQQQIDPDSVNSLLSVIDRRGSSTLISNSWWAASGADVFEKEGISVISDMDIVNYPELLKLLEREPGNNAQLINELYLRYGLNTFEKLRGTFSISILDRNKSKIIVVTDRFGLKPVYYYSDGKRFIFGSTIKSILSIPHLQCREIDCEAIVDYINLSTIPTPKTIYKNIRKLPSGHFLIIEKNKMTPQISKYYDIKYTEMKSEEGYFLNKIPLSIENSVKTILEHEVARSSKMGSFLSGGTDSSTIAGIMKKLNGHVKTFSIGFDEEGYNELEYARIASKHFGTEHHEYMVTPEDVLESLDLIIDVYDEPFGNASAVPTYFCARLAKENGVDTLMAGDAGDEIFGGNERYVADNIFNIYHKIPHILRSNVLEPLISKMPSSISLINKGKKYIRRANYPQPERFYSYNPVATFGREEIFSRSFLENIEKYDPLALARELYAEAQTEDRLNKLLYLDMKFAITDNDIRKVTDMSEKAGVRVCYPFLDYKLVDFAATIPADLKIKGTCLRYIFKKSLEDFLPAEIIKKKKHGFGLPIGKWINTKNGINSIVRETLLSPNSFIRPYFRKGFIKELFDSHSRSGAAYYGDILWVLLVFELWSRKCKVI